MSFTNLSAREINQIQSSTNARATYPWTTRKVGEGFAVPKSNFRNSSRPAVPPTLRRQNIRYTITSAEVDGVDSFVAIRIA